MFGFFKKKSATDGGSLSISADVANIPSSNRRHFDFVADACHLHIHQLVSLDGLGELSRHAVYVRDGFGNVELAGPIQLPLLRSPGMGLKASVMLGGLRNLGIYRQSLMRSGLSSAQVDRMSIDVPNQVISILAGEAAAGLLSGRQDLQQRGI